MSSAIYLSQEDMVFKSLPALRELYSHAVGLFLRDKATGQFTGYSSGVLVEFRKGLYIATAGHNLNDRPLDLTLWLNNDGEVLEGEPLIEAVGQDPKIRFIVDDLQGLDLGLIQIQNPERLKRAGKKFYSLPEQETSRHIQDEALLFLVGFPARYAGVKEVQKTPGGLLLPRTVSMQVITTIPVPCFGDVPQQDEVGFEMRVECKDPTEDESLSYAGFSGGPVFILTDLSGLSGDPRGFTLIGLEYFQSLHRHHAVLKCNFIQEWCRFCKNELEL